MRNKNIEFKLCGIKISMNEDTNEDTNEVTWRTLLSPAQQGMIDSGRCELVDDSGNTVSNIDLSIPIHLLRNSTGSDVHYQIKEHKTEGLWIGDYKQYKDILLIFCSSGNQELEEKIKPLRRGGFPVLCFEESGEIKFFWDKHKSYLERFETSFIIGDMKEFEYHQSLFADEIMLRSVALAALINYTEQTDCLTKKLLKDMQVIPAPINLSYNPEKFCKETIESLFSEYKQRPLWAPKSPFIEKQKRDKLYDIVDSEVSSNQDFFQGVYSSMFDFVCSYYLALKRNGTPNLSISDLTRVFNSVSYLRKSHFPGWIREQYRNDDIGSTILNNCKKILEYGMYKMRIERA